VSYGDDGECRATLAHFVISDALLGSHLRVKLMLMFHTSYRYWYGSILHLASILARCRTQDTGRVPVSCAITGSACAEKQARGSHGVPVKCSMRGAVAPWLAPHVPTLCVTA